MGIARMVAAVSGVVFLLVGVLGFIPVAVLRGLGAAYLLLAVIGLFAPEGFGILPLGGGELIIHTATALVFLGVGLLLPARSDEVRSTV